MTRASLLDAGPGLPGLMDGPMVTAIDRRLARLEAESQKPVSHYRKRLSFSGALTCDRKRAFKVLKIPEERENDWLQRMTFDVGHAMHDRLQDVVVHEMGGEIEQPRSWVGEADLWGYADADLNLDDPEGDPDTVGEFKTVKEFPWMLAAGKKVQHEGPGPKLEHVAQACEAALAPSLEVPRSRLWLVYMNKNTSELIEWVVGVDEPLPNAGGRTPRDLVAEDIRRVNEITSAVDVEMLPGRCTVEGRPIEDPLNTRFPCGWCSWQQTCAALPTGPTSAIPLLERMFDAAPTPTSPGSDDGDDESEMPW